jgi:hypothetical protein
MAEKVPGENGPSLELPSLFGRKKKRPADEPPLEPAEPPFTQSVEETAVLPVVDESVTEAEPVRPVTPVRPIEPVAPAKPVAPARPVAPVEPVEPVETIETIETKPRQLPELAASTAALVVGALVGLLGCVLTAVALQGCELLTGTSSCGGPGLLVLLVIVAAMAVLGAALLRAFKVPEAGNLSLLGVGVMVVVALLFLSDHLYAAWMFVAIPLLTALGYGLAAWVTSRYVDEVMVEPDPAERRRNSVRTPQRDSSARE